MIQISAVSKSFGTTPVLTGIHFELESGETAVIRGPSGSGKTTLLRLIAGLDSPDLGQISLNNQLVSSPDIYLPPQERNIGFLFQTNALWPHLTVYQNVAFGLGNLSKADRSRHVQQILDRMGIGEFRTRYPHQLSGGQQRRTALARTLVNRPDFLLLDEPLINLDPDLQHSLLDLLMEIIQQSGITTLLVTHRKLENLQIPWKTLSLNNGFLDEN